MAALTGWCTLELCCGWEVQGGPTDGAFAYAVMSHLKLDLSHQGSHGPPPGRVLLGSRLRGKDPEEPKGIRHH